MPSLLQRATGSFILLYMAMIKLQLWRNLINLFQDAEDKALKDGNGLLHLRDSEVLLKSHLEGEHWGIRGGGREHVEIAAVWSMKFIINLVCPTVYNYHVFVYGTLKKGQPNHSIIINTTIGQAEFLSHARTVEQYPLVIATKNNYPFLLNVPGKGKLVHGEIYSVDQKMLDFLDEFEECPELYQRTKVQLEVQDGDGEGENTLKPGSIEEAFLYSTNTYEPEWLQKPTYDNYDTNGDHGLPYHEDTSPE